MINLLTQRVRQQRHTDHLNYYTITGGMIIAAGVIAVATLMLLFDRIYVFNLSTLQNQKATSDGQAALYLNTENQAKQLQSELQLLKAGQKQGTHWATLMTELQAVTPPGVNLKTIQANQPGAVSAIGAAGAAKAAAIAPTSNKTQISGSADSRRSVAQFQLALEKSKYFKNPEIQTTNRQGGTTVDYTISVEINYSKLAGPPV